MSQKAAIYAYLKSGRSITPMDALQKFGCFRLAARVCELRREGKPIIGEPQGKHFVYRLGAHH